MEELYNIISSSARLNKRKKKSPPVQAISTTRGLSHGNVTSSLHLVKDTEKYRKKVAVGGSSVELHDGASSDESDRGETAVIGLFRNGRPKLNSAEASNTRRANGIDRQQLKQMQLHREEVAAFRNRLKIKLGKKSCKDDCPDPISAFEQIQCPHWWHRADLEIGTTAREKANAFNSSPLFDSIKKNMLENIEAGKWLEPTPIQMQCIPAIMDRNDTMGAAPTGSGKSGAFIIPALFITSLPSSIYYGSEDLTIRNGKSESEKVSRMSKDLKMRSHVKRKGRRDGEIRSLLLAPSRELASQLHREAARLGNGRIGGLRTVLLSKSNVTQLMNGNMGGKRGVDILVSTPLRLCACLTEGNDHNGLLDLSAVRLLVLDEADRLLDASDGSSSHSFDHNLSADSDEDDGLGNDSREERSNGDNNQRKVNKSSGQRPKLTMQSGSLHAMTFVEQVDTILAACPSTATRCLFSATMGQNVRYLAESVLRNPVDVTVATTQGANPDIEQKLVFVGREEGKLLAVRQLIWKGLNPPVLIFLQSKVRAQALFAELMYDGVNVDVIHAGKSQAARDASVAKFRNGDTWILISTDLVGRGVDFKAVNLVINYDLPSSGVAYTHRIGRTGRAGRKGQAITYFTESDFDSLRTIANVMKLSGCVVPDWMLSLKKVEGTSEKKSRLANIRRGRIGTSPIDKKRRLKNCPSRVDDRSKTKI